MTTIAPLELETSPRSGRRSVRGELVPLAPAGLLVALWIFWIGSSGGYYPTTWYPSALASLSVLGLTMALRRRVLPSALPARVALLAYGGLVGWNFLSILWADSPGIALGSADELLLYLAIGWTFALLPWTPRALAAVVAVWSLAIAAFCAIDLLRALGAREIVHFFDEYRWSTPVGYTNATGALAMMGALPALVLSAARGVARPLRCLLLAVAVFLAEFALLPQSRGVLVGGVAGLLLMLLVAGDRWRLLGRLMVVAAGLGLSIPRTIAVNAALNANRPVLPVLRHAGAIMAATAVGALLLGAALVAIESRWGRPAVRRRVRLDRRLALGLAALAVCAFGAAAALAGPPVVHYVRQNTRVENSPGGSRLLSISPEERFDYLRVGLDLFLRHPALGVGAGNFGVHYDKLRRFEKHSSYTHDLALRALTETGLPGLGLMLTTVLALLWGLLRGAARQPGLERGCSVAVLALCAYFTVHASLDWMDEFPVLAAPALALALAVPALGHGRAAGGRRREPQLGQGLAGAGRRELRTRLSRKARAAGGAIGALRWGALAVAAVAATVLLTGPYLSTRYVNRALSEFALHPGAASRDLDRAASLDPLSSAPMVTRGLIDEQLHEPAAARAAFAAALRRERGWFPRFEIALLDAQAGRFGSARADLAQVAALDSADPLVAEAGRLVARRDRIDPLRFNELLLRGPQSSFFERQNIK